MYHQRGEVTAVRADPRRAGGLRGLPAADPDDPQCGNRGSRRGKQHSRVAVGHGHIFSHNALLGVVEIETQLSVVRTIYTIISHICGYIYFQL